MALPLTIDIVNRIVVQGFTNPGPAEVPPFYVGNTVPLWLRFVEPTGTPYAPYVDVDYSAADVFLRIGSAAAIPQFGAFTLTDPSTGATTKPILWNADAQTVALLVSTLPNWNNCAVSGSRGGPWMIDRGEFGAITPLTGASVSLEPPSEVLVSELQIGSSTLPEIVFVRPAAFPLVELTDFTPYPAPTVVVTEVQAGSPSPAANEIQQVSFTGMPYAGTFTLSFGGQTTSPIPWNATVGQVQAALAALSSIGAGNVAVSISSYGQALVMFTGTLANAPQALMTASAANLVGPLALQGTLDLTGKALQVALSNLVSLAQVMQIVAVEDGLTQTAVGAPVFLQNSILPASG